ncbi:uncharacterized protein RCH25_045840 [Pelodytes ibericus]
MNEVSVLRLPVEEAVNEVIHGLDGVALKHSDSRLPFQIFPDPCEEEEVPVKMRGRLPSIVVEPTDIIDVESGELRWPLDCIRKEKEEGMLEEEETEEEELDKHNDHCIQVLECRSPLPRAVCIASSMTRIDSTSSSQSRNEGARVCFQYLGIKSLAAFNRWIVKDHLYAPMGCCVVGLSAGRLINPRKKQKKQNLSKADVNRAEDT